MNEMAPHLTRPLVVAHGPHPYSCIRVSGSQPPPEGEIRALGNLNVKSVHQEISKIRDKGKPAYRVRTYSRRAQAAVRRIVSHVVRPDGCRLFWSLHCTNTHDDALAGSCGPGRLCCPRLGATASKCECKFPTVSIKQRIYQP